MSTLPLIERAREGGYSFVMSRQASPAADEPLYQISSTISAPRIPERALQPGEQYRFHFDMTQCIGCKCCMVACNEQNGNPASINWRRVGEIEGGFYPNTQRSYLSMGCNHCLEPSCLIGCPVEAYKKDPVTGIVQHSAEACIGCQYCTWNCSYGVPQYNPERGVVGKCDMCYGRLTDGREPACVNACPEGAIRIEIVNVEEWKREYSENANAPGLPSADDSISTTRITLPEQLPPDTRKADAWRVRPEHPHWPLVVMTVLTQLSVGAFAAIWLLQLLGAPGRLTIAAIGSLTVGGLALGASTMHLGRPIHAYRALKMWKRSWLSREVLMFGLFSGMAGAYAGSLLLKLASSSALGGLTALLGAGGITASACIYLVRARPAWNSKHTIADFFLTASILGPLFAANISAGSGRLLALIAVAGASAQLLNNALRFLRLNASESFERQSTARLLSTVLASRFLLRGALLVAGGIALPLLSAAHLGLALALALALGGELLGRYLFYVSVVPKNIAASYIASGMEMAG
ncbi:MAG TPA: DmsC/YnfH family molybdoenzyme membrane anchor subunit [Terriglobales bacterium]|jgi:DMSO reductase iron-sulfur subunit|nr:DmsC/YnfH family molybdoenzyme membrane anchor subunit [Terriglobales bacterium]